MHPAHVPFEGEPESADVRRTRHHGPSGRFFGNGYHTWKLGLDDVIELFKELDRFKVLAPAKFIRDPFALFAGVIEIKHRRDSIDAQAVDMKSLAPKQGIGQQKISHFMAPVIEYERPPVLVRALAGILMLVKGSAVEIGQRPVVTRKMGGHPVGDHANAGFVQCIDQELKILRCAKTAGGGKKTGHLISPRGIERMLGDWQEFSVGKSHFLEILSHAPGDLTVGERFVFVLLHPRTHVDFINAHGALEWIALAAFFKPSFVSPVEIAVIPDNGGVLGRTFKEKPVRVGFE